MDSGAARSIVQPLSVACRFVKVLEMGYRDIE